MYISVKQASELLQISTDTLYKLVKANEIEHLKIGKLIRFDKHKLIESITQDTQDIPAIKNTKESNIYKYCKARY